MDRDAYRQNAMLLATICICTVTVALLGGGAGGLWSLLLLCVWLSPVTRECSCDESDEGDEQQKQPQQ